MGETASTQHHGPQCGLPSCRNGVERWGQPYQDCRTAFRTRLRRAFAPAMTREQIAKRDRDVERALALHRQVRVGRAATNAPPQPRRRSA